MKGRENMKSEDNKFLIIKRDGGRNCERCIKNDFFYSGEVCSILEKEKEEAALLLFNEVYEDLAHFSSEKVKIDYLESICKKERSEDECEFECKFIEMPLTLEELKIENNIDYEGSLVKCQKGKFVKCRYEKETYLGIYLGDLPRSLNLSFNKESRSLEITSGYSNPAMWIFKLKKIVWGCESWWSIIETPEEFGPITDEDIENVSYVKILRKILEE